jgi:hypothetical protein
MEHAISKKPFGICSIADPYIRVCKGAKDV